MSFVECHFCAGSNPTNAKVCSSCLMQLDLAPCPYCDEVNEVTALICQACKGSLLQASVERSARAYEHAATTAAFGGASVVSQLGPRLRAGGGLLGSIPESYAGTDVVAARDLGRFGGSMRPAGPDMPAARLRMEAERNAARIAKTNALSRPMPQFLTRALTIVKHPIVVTGGVCFLVAIGLLSIGLSRIPARLSPPVPSAVPGPVTTSTESGALGHRTVTIQGESVAAIPLAQPAQQPAAADRESTTAFPFIAVTARADSQDENASVGKSVKAVPPRASAQSSVADAKDTGSAAGCTDGVMALGLCPSAPLQAQPATQVTSSIDVPGWPSKVDTSGGCKQAAFALGLCQ